MKTDQKDAKLVQTYCKREAKRMDGKHVKGSLWLLQARFRNGLVDG